MCTVLIATTGVSIHHIYCYCVGKTTNTLFDVAGQCMGHETAQKADDCCTPKPAAKTCCQKPEKKSGAHCNSSKSKPCTSTTTTVLQMKDKFTVEKPAVKSLAVPAVLPVIPVFAAVCLPCALLKKSPQRLAHPPPRSGRDISIAHAVFLC